ncbi:MULTISPECIES: DUF3043 domain-containing protein [unclassified Crossiella]|uniref:DUF3043 domain-containing protein n=1 Tax=unclassified Crossiella TaxID=2620835 RepID=UPI001FFFD19E|nr:MULTISPECIES: DUF3043 domain-containing protein [unclassified Crossiella]MCK2240099.1 DUF3043 domain-containing protein [Crossiella sp. S99.2]MCK2253449.1 DUF3043 domain-containing protein [Crossiella sp. S99.1]
MRFLRRNSTESTTGPEEGVSSAELAEPIEGDKGRTPAKGRATPKRREAEVRKRGPVPPPPRTQREALRRAKGNKEDRRKAAAIRRERMNAGDDAYLMPRDRGPARAYVRDLVDSRRNLMGLFMPLAIIVFVSILTPSPMIKQYASLFCMFMLLSMIIEGIVLGRLVTRKVRERFPSDTSRGFGLGWYAFTRATQIRKLRMPKPRVKAGTAV